MDRIEEVFNVLFSDEQKPYFQVSEDNRIVIPFSNLEGKPSFVKTIISLLFDRDSKIDVSFLKYYIPKGFKKTRSFENKTLHNTINIKNWEERRITKEEFGDDLVYVTVKDILKEEIFKYILTLLKGKKDAYIAFYNDDYLLTIDSDEILIIVKDKELIAPVKVLVDETLDSR